MGLHFYTGGAGAAYTDNMLRDMIRQSMAEPDRRFFIIVPEQATMEMQRRVVSLHPRRAILNLEVTSLMKLAFRVFEETGRGREPVLEEIGKTFLLEKVALEQKNSLTQLGRLLVRPEYLARMKSLISELMLYEVSPEDLERTETGSGRLRAKLKDTAAVYRAFREKLEGTYMTAEDVPDRFCEAVPESGLLRGCVIALDGFTGFTPVQYRLIERFLLAASDVSVALMLDEGRSVFDSWKQTDLFAMSLETAQTLIRLARKAGIPVDERQTGDGGHAAEEIRFLGKHLFRAGAPVYPGAPRAVAIAEAADPRTESAACAAEICRLVREEGMRFRDLAVVTGDLETYRICLTEVMGEYGIPFFLDMRRQLTGNPFIEYMRAALEVCAEQYSFDSMFRLLKNSMSGFDPEAVSHLENYALGTGLRGKGRWRETFVRSYRDENPAEIPYLEKLRQEICARLDPLSDALAERGGTVRTKAAALYRFFAESDAEGWLRREEERCRAEGRPDLASEYAQVYPYVCSFLDKLVSVLGEERISMTDFRALLEAGFAEGRVAVIPPGGDRVIVGDVERTRVPQVKVLFFLGVNEGVIPKASMVTGLLTEADRESLLAAEIRLKPTSRQALYIERFYLYSVLSKPSERLWVSYCRTSPSGGKMNPSYLVDSLCRLFPDLRIRGEDEGLPERPAAGLHLLARALRDPERTPLTPEMKELYLYLREAPEYAVHTERLMEAAFSRKPEDRIGRAAARALYGARLRNSASRLERFCGCAFAHFAQYGLRLKERPEYAFSGMDFGNIMHRALELFGSAIRDGGPGLSRLSDEQLASARDAAFEQAVNEVSRGSALFSSARDEYRITRMRRLMDTAAGAVAEQLKAGDFVIYGAEEDFRGREDLSSLNVMLPDGNRMELTGRIDRIDVCRDGDVSYVKIVDYKTGSTKFDAEQIYYGLQLQLALYMNAARELLRRDGLHPVPAGMFYCRVFDPVLPFKEGESDEELAERRLQTLSGSGAVLEDRDVIAHLDRTLAPGRQSAVIPVKYNKDGKLSEHSAVLSAEDFGVIGEYAERKIRDAGARIVSGDAEINPYRLGQETACTYCPYREICGFDERIPGYRYRELARLNAESALARMKEIINEVDA